MKTILSSRDRTQYFLLIACAASLFLPYSLCLIVFLISFVYALYVNSNIIKVFVPNHSVFFYLFFLIAMATAACYRHWFGITMTSLLFLLVVFMFYIQYYMTESLCKNILTVMAYGNIVVALVALFQKYPDLHFRSESFYSNANYYAFICETILIAMVFAIYHFGKEPVYFASILASITGILASGCRTAWVAIFVGIIVLLICLKKFKSLTVFGIFSAVCVALTFSLPKVLFPRQAVFQHDKDLRFMIWKNAISFINEHPLFGQGFMSYFVLSSGRPHDLHAHNLLLDLLINFGFIGSAVLICFVVFYLISAIKNLKVRPIGAVSIAVVASTIAHGITDVPFCGLTTICFLMIFLSFAGFSNKRLTNS